MENQKEHHHHVHESDYAHLDNPDIRVVIQGVTIIVYNNCKSILIQGEGSKTIFDFPIIEDSTHGEHKSGTKQPARETRKKQHKESGKHDHDENFEDMILNVEGVVISICDCFTVLKIKGDDVFMVFPLSKFRTASSVLTEEGDYYIRRYNVELLKNKVNEREQKLFINNNEIEVEYNPANKSFNSHLFFENYTNLIDLLADYLKTNPDLKDIKHNH